MKRIWVLILLLLLFPGCSSGLPISENLKFEIIDWGQEKFEKAPGNKYAVLMRSHLFSNNVYQADKYVANDLTQVARLLYHKGYKVWYVPNPKALYQALRKIGAISDGDTQTFVAYSGKGDSQGLRLYGEYVSKSFLIIPPNVTISPRGLIPAMAGIKGEKALLINACESGIFPDFARSFRLNGRFFDGIIVASCAVGELTTPYEPAETTAVYATFLENYANDLDKIVDISDMDIDTVGGWWYNLLHKLSNEIDRIGNSNIKPISYDTVVYRGGSYKL